jgi:hypothetical protein
MMLQSARHFRPGAQSSLTTVARHLWTEAQMSAVPIVVLILDGLGVSMLERFGEAMPYLTTAWLDANKPRVRSCFPSTTVTCLASFGRATSPAEHGLVGYSFRARVGSDETQIVRPTHLAADAPKLALGDAPTLADKKVAFIVAGQIRTPYLSREAFPRASQSRLVEGPHMGKRLARSVDHCDLAFFYLGIVDSAAHRHGLGSRPHLASLKRADEICSELVRDLERRILVITADHGMVDVDRWLELERFVPSRHLTGIGGEARAVHLYVRQGEVAAVRDSCAVIPHATIIERTEMDASGVLDGPLDVAVADRLGDFVVTFEDPGMGVSWRGGPGERRARAQHGGLSEDELFVPFVRLLASG